MEVDTAELLNVLNSSQTMYSQILCRVLSIIHKPGFLKDLPCMRQCVQVYMIAAGNLPDCPVPGLPSTLTEEKKI